MSNSARDEEPMLKSISGFAFTLPVIGLVGLIGCGAGSDKSNVTGFTDGGFAPDGGDTGPSFGFDGAADPDVPFDPDAACAARTFSGTKLPLTIAVVFDQSSSMGMSGGSGSRIDLAKGGLKKAFSDPRFSDVSIGLFRYGYIEGLSGCSWDKTPTYLPKLLSADSAGIFAAIDKLDASGATPTKSALNASYAWLAPQIRDKKIDGKVAVVLVTDGAPTCGEADEPVAEFWDLVAKGRLAKIDTFIVGLPGSGEAFESKDKFGEAPHTTSVLSKMAAKGTDEVNLPPGCDKDPTPISKRTTKPCYFDLASSGLSTDSLANALENIRRVSTACEYGIPEPSPKYDTANPGVYLTDETGKTTEIRACVDPAAPPAEGCWIWADTAKTRVKLLSGACTKVRDNEKIRVDVLLSCKVR